MNNNYRTTFRDMLFMIIHKKRKTKNDEYSEIIMRIECLLYNQVISKFIYESANESANFINSKNFIEMYNQVTYNELGKIRNKTFNEDTNQLNMDYTDIDYAKLKDKQVIFDHLLENPMKVEEGVFVCRKCNSKKTYSYAKQTRGCDEPMTNFITCYKCGKKWTE